MTTNNDTPITVRGTIDDTTRIFFLANSAHNAVDEAMSRLRKYKKLAKKVDDVYTFRGMVEAIRAAKDDLDKANESWDKIVEIIANNPELHAD